ncbi:Ulp1-like peptidase [Cucumis melo var. makuwa]|uniref:Ulp1-like peptidase n=1 Tax=Cucumis melo var. makuwa TaxID=1194695 RepID=A0A5D3DM85_CUCMM|nr:Ulp1-like peptidase [Cucumis melo var. makuwa]TYK24409.1 Ulp1-like peptidase [Cucumis melo var. makuwa]
MCLEVEEVFKKFDFTNDDDAVKVALALFIKTMVVGKDKKILKTILQRSKKSFELKRARSLKAVAYYNIKGYVLAFEVWAYETLSTTIVRLKLKLSPQEKAFKESWIQRDDNMDIEDDDSMPDFTNSDTNTPIDTMNNQSSDHNDLSNLRSTSSPLLQSNVNVGGLPSIVQPSPQRKERQTTIDQPETNPITNNKRSISNDKP